MPILNAHSLEIISRSPEQTRRIGMRLGALLKLGDLVKLSGDLGSGKTTLVQGLGSGWGSLDQVSSPTFVIVNVYQRLGEQRMYHLDAYRLSGPQEAIDLDLDTMLAGGSLVVEWAERIDAALPIDSLWIRLKWIDDSQRDLVVSAHGSHYEALLETFRKHVYGG